MLSFKEFITEELKRLSGALGSNEGGTFRDEKGQKFYRKHYRDGEQAKVEELTGKIHKSLGIRGFDPKYSNEDGKHTITTKWNDDVRPSRSSDYHSLSKDQAHDLAKMYHASVLTKNHDVVGTGRDNVMKDSGGNFHSIDHGGAFHFRAMGGSKEYDPHANEIHSMKEPVHDAGRVFTAVEKQHPTAFHDTIHAVKNLDPKEIHDHFKSSGLKNWEELHNTFNKRKEKLIAHYAKKPALQESHLHDYHDAKAILHGDLAIEYEKQGNRGLAQKHSLAASAHTAAHNAIGTDKYNYHRRNADDASSQATY